MNGYETNTNITNNAKQAYPFTECVGTIKFQWWEILICYGECIK